MNDPATSFPRVWTGIWATCGDVRKLVDLMEFHNTDMATASRVASECYRRKVFSLIIIEAGIQGIAHENALVYYHEVFMNVVPELKKQCCDTSETTSDDVPEWLYRVNFGQLIARYPELDPAAFGERGGQRLEVSNSYQQVTKPTLHTVLQIMGEQSYGLADRAQNYVPTTTCGSGA